MSAISVLVAVVLTITSINAFNHELVPADKILSYKWAASIRTGTYAPTFYASSFNLNGTVCLQSINNSTLFKISDLTYKIYNGIHNHIVENETKSLPLPEESLTELQKIFKVDYDENGLIEGIATEKDEKEFSRNIKKAIASVFQLDYKTVFGKVSNLESFTVKENSLEGLVNFVYDVVPKGDKIGVHKFYEYSKENLDRYLVKNEKTSSCDAPQEKQVTRSGMKKYLIGKKDGQDLVEKITTSGDVIYYPSNLQSNFYSIVTSQSFDLIDIKPVEEKWSLPNELAQDDLTYLPYVPTQDGSIFDVTNGRRVVDKNKLIQRSTKLILKLCQYQEDDFQEKEPKNKDSKNINRIHDIFLKLDKENFEAVRVSLRNTSCTKAFYKMLPMVGTEASTLYIKDLIFGNGTIIDTYVAINLLENLASNLVAPSRDLVTEMEVLYSKDIPHWTVRNPAILAFAALVHKASSFEKLQGKDPDYYNKYVTLYVEKARESNDTNYRMAFLMGLANMKLPSVQESLLPGYNGTWWDDPKLKFLSAFPALVSAKSDEDPSAILKTAWPIFINRNEQTDLRVIAYYNLMESKPSESTLRNIARAILTEPDPALYSFHYNYIKAMAQTNDPCKQHFKNQMIQLLKITSPPKQDFSFVQNLDYRDSTVGFSTAVRIFQVRTNGSRIYAIKLESQDFSVLGQDFTIVLKVHDGKDHGSNDPLVLAYDFLTGNPKIKYLDFVLMRPGVILKSYHIDSTTLYGAMIGLSSIFSNPYSLEMKHWDVSFKKNSARLVPLDLGIPAFWEYQMPEINLYDINYKREKFHTNVNISSRVTKSIYYRHGLTVYNPFVDIWQGVNRIQQFDAAIPFNFRYVSDYPRNEATISWHKNENPLMNVGGIRTFVKESVFVMGDESHLLEKANPQSKPWVDVQYSRKYKRYPLIENEEPRLGHKWYLGFFNSSNSFSFGGFKNKLEKFFDKSTKSFYTPLSYLLLSMDNLQTYLLKLPVSGTYGFLFRFEPLESVSSIDLTVKYTSDESEDTLLYLPGSKRKVQLVYDVKNQDATLKSWNVTAALDMSPGHTVNSFNLEVFGEDSCKIVVQGSQNWTAEEIVAHASIDSNGTTTQIEMTAQKSEEQQEGDGYGDCQYFVPYFKKNYYTCQCLVSRSTVRHYSFEVAGSNQWVLPVLDHLKYFLHSYYSQDNLKTGVDSNVIKFDVEYPTQYPEVNINLTTSKSVYALTGVPTNYLKWFGFYPESLIYPSYFTTPVRSLRQTHLDVYPTQVLLNGRKIGREVPEEWSINYPEYKDLNVSFIFNTSCICVKVLDHGHKIEVDGNQIRLDGEVVPSSETKDEDWVYYDVLTQDVGKPVVVVLKQSGIRFVYEKDHVAMVLPSPFPWLEVINEWVNGNETSR